MGLDLRIFINWFGSYDLISGFGSQDLDLLVWVSVFGSLGLSFKIWISGLGSQDLDCLVCVSRFGSLNLGLRI